MFNCYRKFIPNFSEIVKRIVELTRKRTNFKWTPERQLAFDTLKEYLTKSPILVYPDSNKECYLFTDASKYKLSAILMQKHTTNTEQEMNTQHHVGFLSGAFRESQQNWVTLTKEAYAIYMVFRKFSYY